MKKFQWLGLFAAATLLVFGMGCPPEDDGPDDEPGVTTYEVELAGENEVPPLASRATGTMDVEFDEEDNLLTVEGEFDNLVSELIDVGGSSAHLHAAGEDEVGPVIHNVEVDPDSDGRSGTFEFSEELSSDGASTFEDQRFYLNIHTSAYPGGELRGQLDEDTPEYDDVAESWGMRLSEQAQPHSDEIDTDGDGWAWAILRDDNSMTVSGAVEDLTSDVTEVTIEHAEPGETGNVILTLEPDNGQDGFRFWTREDLNGDQVDDMTNGEYYINVATEDHEDGELRAQIEEDADSWEELFDDVPDPGQQAPVF